MKKVLLTTTALVMTAGVASADLAWTFKGEAGFYRNAPTAATAGVDGVDAANTADATAAPDANADGAAQVGFFGAAADAGRTLTVVASTGTPSTNNVAQADIDALKVDIANAYAAAQVHLDAANAQAATADYVADMNAMTADLALAAELEKQLELVEGTAAVGKGATPKMLSYSGYDLDVKASAEADNGMSFAMALDMGAGLIADQDDDRAMDAQAGAVATSAMTIEYAGYTVEIGDDKIDDLYSDDQNGDVSIAGSLGDLKFKIVTDMDADVAAVEESLVYTVTGAAADFDDLDTLVYTAATSAVYNPTSYSLGYTVGNVAFAMAGTEHNTKGDAAAKMSLTYTMSDALSVKYGIDNAGSLKDISELSATAKISDMLTVTASIKDDKDHPGNTNEGGKQSTNASIAYAAGSLKATVATDESSAWWVNAQYDLGGGAQAFTTFDHSEFFVAGVNFKF